jgi:hypothetical protein
MEKGNKIVLIIGFLAIGASVFVTFEAASFLKKAISTQGKVVHVLGSSYQLQYFTADGVRKIYQGSGKTHGFHEGDNVPIWYKTDDPNSIRLSDGKKGAKILFISGIVCILLGIYPLFLKKKNRLTFS